MYQVTMGHNITSIITRIINTQADTDQLLSLAS